MRALCLLSEVLTCILSGYVCPSFLGPNHIILHNIVINCFLPNFTPHLKVRVWHGVFPHWCDPYPKPVQPAIAKASKVFNTAHFVKALHKTKNESLQCFLEA